MVMSSSTYTRLSHPVCAKLALPRIPAHTPARLIKPCSRDAPADEAGKLTCILSHAGILGSEPGPRKPLLPAGTLVGGRQIYGHAEVPQKPERQDREFPTHP